MKKAKMIFIPLVAVGMLSGCGSKQSDPTSDLFTYKDGLIDFGSNFKSNYYPVLSEIKKQDYSGQITIALDFEGKQSGYEEVAKEYMRLHDNSVIIKINADHSGKEYSDKAKSVLESGKGENPEWNIVQGNLLGGIDKNALLDEVSVSGKNIYAGNVSWSSVLTSDASDSSNKFIVNTENLQTAWFINTVALKDASNNGYSLKNTDGTPANPKTWDDLVSLCTAMQKAGYEYPLGLSLDTTSISQTQFSWLLRVYGDYYYRNEYTKIIDGESYGKWVVDLTDPDVEANNDFAYKPGRLFNLILDTASKNYVGANSDKFKEFISQFKKIGTFINEQNVNKKFSDVRGQFSTQSDGKKSPQIMLDYLGEGLGYKPNENDSYKLDYFDNPVMVSDGGYIQDKTLLRDVGGNGGYLSIASHSKNIKVDEISRDFIKFFLSPYGQSIYYAKLAQGSLHPQGITTVKRNLVIIPEKWSEFLGNDNEKVTFSGLVDKDPFLSFLIRYLDTNGKYTNENAPSMWATLLTKSEKTPEAFCTEWSGYLDKDWDQYADTMGYNHKCYEHPDESEYAKEYDN